MIRRAEDGPMRMHFIMNSHNLATSQEIKTEVTKRQVGSECSDGKNGRRNGRGCFHERIVQMCFQRYWQEQGLRGRVLVLRGERSSSFRLSQETKGPRQGTVEGFRRKATQQREKQQERVSKVKATSVARQVRCRRIADPKKRVHSKPANRAWQRPDASK